MALSASQDQQEFLFELMGGGDEARWEAIRQAVNAGADVLSLGGYELPGALTLVEGSARTITATSATAMTGWVHPTVTYVGRPITIELDIPSISHGALPATVNFEVRGQINGGASTRFLTKGTTIPAGTTSWALSMSGTLPVAGQLSLTVGDQIQNLQVFSFVSGGTATINSFWNNGVVGSTPVRFRCVQQ